MNAPGNLDSQPRSYPGARAGDVIKADEYHNVFLGLGSNIAPDLNLVRGVIYLRQYVIVQQYSSVWETAPVPAVGPNYLNAVVLIKTQLSPNLLRTIILHRIEAQLGRLRTSNKNAPRTIDIDILIYDDHLMDSKVWTHAFVAVPLAELIPDFTNSNTGETLRQIADRLSKNSSVKLRPDIVLD